MSGIKKETVDGLKWTALERFSVQGVNFFIGVVLARLLSPTDFGTIGMISIFISISSIIVDSGFSNALIRKADCSEIDYSTVFYINIFIGFVCYVILYLTSGIIADFFSIPVLSDLVKVLSINLILNSLIVVHIAKLTRLLNFKIQALTSFASAIISGIIGVFFAYKGAGVWSLVWQSISCSLVKIILIECYTLWYPKNAFSWRSFESLFSYGSKILTAGLLNTLYTNLSTLLIGRFYSANDLGLYTRGNHLAQLPSTNITGLLQKVTFPILSKLQNDDNHLITVYRKYIQVSSLGIFFLMILFVSLSKPIVIFLLTDKWLGCIIYFQIVCFALMFDHISAINLNILQVKGRSDLFLRLEIIKKTISFVILIVAIPFGVIAVCFSQVLYTQIAMFLNTYYTGKLYGLGYLEQWKDFYPYIVYSIISCIPAFFITYTDIPLLIQMGVGSVLAIILYIVLLLFMKDQGGAAVFEIFINRYKANKNFKHVIS